MRYWCIEGYGLDYSQLVNYINQDKLMSYLLTNGIETKIACEDVSIIELVEEYIMAQNSIIDFCYSTNTSYILISSILPWQMNHLDYQSINTMEAAQEYLWQYLQPIVNDNLLKKDFILMLDYINDVCIN